MTMDYKRQLDNFFVRCVICDIAPLNLRKCFIQCLYSFLDSNVKAVLGHYFSFSRTLSTEKSVFGSSTMFAMFSSRFL